MPPLVSLLVEATPRFVASDPFFAVEFYAFRVALLIIFIIALYRLVKHEVSK